MKATKIIYVVIGCIALALGTVGTMLPILPTVPLYMLAAFCFAKSSEKLHTWFTGTQLYKKNLESFVQGKGMTMATKIRIVGTVTVLMAFGFFMMFRKGLTVPCVILAAVWIFHIVYFFFGVKTIKE